MCDSKCNNGTNVVMFQYIQNACDYIKVVVPPDKGNRLVPGNYDVCMGSCLNLTEAQINVQSDWLYTYLVEYEQTEPYLRMIGSTIYGDIDDIRKRRFSSIPDCGCEAIHMRVNNGPPDSRNRRDL
ncbi:putative mitochondrial import inner membrane translocase subunit [Clavispora lusitaniae]|uniref:Mitochondrial import inner membrane translocase subunit n=1 Tax=Clavispora lusitaniae TaxID=36911 RepID=A0ACD0WKB7_CLALS|nr:hypothetical protein FOB63_005341 [Clavispora lusitaniae]QFZ27836.1 putative mitochondrial import inner membrane translocase subunit [Clavispora lusitaniae]QFZ32857.1 putative mitochondrial import inner membrane translocase subunit [Clavispora lusitaniae]QFZ38527.1 putative mitochondrial import inner membrane translocase subunit [Clavispora lusitaniae]QFZ44209.1 putative mitochondrial import inner membrane translocase subunit [Clavispora lusitaniae]